MNWQLKAWTQNVVAALPMADAVYYAIQRTRGSLRPGRVTPHEWFTAAVTMVEWIRSVGQEVQDKRFLEVGTGRMLGLPTALWLCGAAETVTIDLNAYLSEALVAESNRYMREHRSEILKLFRAEAAPPGFRERFQRLVGFSGSLTSFMQMTNTRYLAPADATALPFPDERFDFHVSHAVLEHVPCAAVAQVLGEAKRLLRPNGLLVHVIDPSDHFSHDDTSILAVNFLKFEEREWERWAGNKFSYHNRLRACEYVKLFEAAGLRIIHQTQTIDEPSLALLKNGFPLATRFRPIRPEDLAVRSLNLMASKADADSAGPSRAAGAGVLTQVPADPAPAQIPGFREPARDDRGRPSDHRLAPPDYVSVPGCREG